MLPTNPTFISQQSPTSKRHTRPSLNTNPESPVRHSFYPSAQTIPQFILTLNNKRTENKSSTQSFSNSDSPPYNPVQSPICTQDFLFIPKRIFDHSHKECESSAQAASQKKKAFVPKAEHKKTVHSEAIVPTGNVQADPKMIEPIKIKISEQLNENRNIFAGQNALAGRNKTENFQSVGVKLKNRQRMSEIPMKNHNFELAIPAQNYSGPRQKINTVLSTNDIHQSFGPTKNYLVPPQAKQMPIFRSNSKRKQYISVTPTKYRITQPYRLKSMEKTQKTNFVPSKKSINRFQILKLIGSSKLSEAYVCRDKKSGSIYCLKKIKKSLINQSPSLLNQFIRKIGLQFRSVHPNIIQIYDVFCDNEFVYLVEEYMQSGSLRDFINEEKSGKIPVDETKSEKGIIEKLYNINLGLNYIHDLENEKKIKVGPRIHGDLRPETVLINFGCCKISPINPIKIEKTVSFLHPYVCPEALVEQNLTAKSDMWNLGLILFELCARRRLFKVQQTKYDMSLADQIVSMDYNKQILNIQFVTHSLKDLIRKLLMVRPDERISSSDLMNSSIFKKRAGQDPQLGTKNPQNQSPEIQRFKRQIKTQNNNFPKYQYNPTRFNIYLPGRASEKLI